MCFLLYHLSALSIFLFFLFLLAADAESAAVEPLVVLNLLSLLVDPTLFLLP